VEDQETLKGRAVISNTANLVDNGIDKLLANGVMSSSIVICSILFTANQVFRVEELSVFTSADFIDWGRVQINKDGSWYVFSSSSFGEEGFEGSVVYIVGFGVDGPVWEETMFQKVQLPGAVTELDTSLSNMEMENLTMPRDLVRHFESED